MFLATCDVIGLLQTRESSDTQCGLICQYRLGENAVYSRAIAVYGSIPDFDVEVNLRVHATVAMDDKVFAAKAFAIRDFPVMKEQMVQGRRGC